MCCRTLLATSASGTTLRRRAGHETHARLNGHAGRVLHVRGRKPAGACPAPPRGRNAPLTRMCTLRSTSWERSHPSGSWSSTRIPQVLAANRRPKLPSPAIATNLAPCDFAPPRRWRPSEALGRTIRFSLWFAHLGGVKVDTAAYVRFQAPVFEPFGAAKNLFRKGLPHAARQTDGGCSVRQRAIDGMLQ